MLIELLLDQLHRQLCRVDRHVQLLKYVRNGTDMIFMTVCDHKALDLAVVLLQIGHIRDDKVNSQHIILRKCESAVHDDDAVTVFESRDVHSDLSQSTQRNDFQLSGILF